MQLVRARLVLGLRCFPPSSLAFSLVQVLLLHFLLLASVKGFFFSIKIEKRKEERDISWVHRPILWPLAFSLVEVQVLSGTAGKHFESSQCVFGGFLHEFHLYHLKQPMQGRHLQYVGTPWLRLLQCLQCP